MEARWADGKAIVTIEASSTIISWATTTTRMDQRLGSGAASVEVSGVVSVRLAKAAGY